VEPTGTFTDGDALDEYYKFRTRKYQLTQGCTTALLTASLQCFSVRYILHVTAINPHVTEDGGGSVTGILHNDYRYGADFFLRV
jgi:hypothetical protein